MMLEFVGQSSRDDRNRAANTGRLLNCYRENAGQGGRTGFVLQPAPGMTTRTQIPGIFLRSMATIGGKIYVACGGMLYSLSGSLAYTAIGAIPNVENTTISGHDGFVTVAASGEYHVKTGTTLTQPAAGAFSNFGAVEALNGYTIITEDNGKRFQWSDLANPLSLPGLNFATAEQRDDNIIRPLVVNGLLWLMGAESCEIWTPTGASGANAFAWMSGGIHDVGLRAFGLATKFDMGAFFVGDDKIVYATDGTQIRPVSTPAVTEAIENGQPDRCLSFERRGHKFCAIIFRDRPAWVYDIATGEWFERSEGVSHQPWGAVASTYSGLRWYVGRDDGTIAELGGSQTDTDGPLVREFTSRTLYRDGERFRVRELELFARKGYSSPANAMVSLSGDDGNTWGKERVVSFGGLGEYADRAILKSLGQFRQITVNVRVTDQNYIPLYCENRIDLA